MILRSSLVSSRCSCSACCDFVPTPDCRLCFRASRYILLGLAGVLLTAASTAGLNLSRQ